MLFENLNQDKAIMSCQDRALSDPSWLFCNVLSPGKMTKTVTLHSSCALIDRKELCLVMGRMLTKLNAQFVITWSCPIALFCIPSLAWPISFSFFLRCLLTFCSRQLYLKTYLITWHNNLARHSKKYFSPAYTEVNDKHYGAFWYGPYGRLSMVLL